MARVILKSKADVLVHELIQKKSTTKEVAKECGINLSYFRMLLAEDKRVGYKTAGKLRSYFGEEAISISRRAD